MKNKHSSSLQAVLRAPCWHWWTVKSEINQMQKISLSNLNADFMLVPPKSREQLFRMSFLFRVTDKTVKNPYFFSPHGRVLDVGEHIWTGEQIWTQHWTSFHQGDVLFHLGLLYKPPPSGVDCTFNRVISTLGVIMWPTSWAGGTKALPAVAPLILNGAASQTFKFCQIFLALQGTDLNMESLISRSSHTGLNLLTAWWQISVKQLVVNCHLNAGLIFDKDGARCRACTAFVFKVVAGDSVGAKHNTRAWISDVSVKILCAQVRSERCLLMRGTQRGHEEDRSAGSDRVPLTVLRWKGSHIVQNRMFFPFFPPK